MSASLTDCNLHYYDYVEQWTANSGYHYEPGVCGPGSNGYYGWVGIDGAMKTPPHFPNLESNNHNYSVGWLDINFSNGSWIQIGWLGGCGGVGSNIICDTSGLGLYDESDNTITGSYVVASDGSLGYGYSDIYRIEYYPSTACWEVFNQYNNLVRSWCGTFPSSGGPTIGSETDNAHTPGQQVEMCSESSFLDS